MYVVYVATNPNIFPPCIKIGYTSDIYRRMEQLSKGQLGYWKEIYTYDVYDIHEAKCVENQLHSAFSLSNSKDTTDCPSREIFFASPHSVNKYVLKYNIKPYRTCRYHCTCKYNDRKLSRNKIKKEYDDWLFTIEKESDHFIDPYRRIYLLEKSIKHDTLLDKNKENAEQLMEIIHTYAKNISNDDRVKLCNILEEIHEPNLEV